MDCQSFEKKDYAIWQVCERKHPPMFFSTIWFCPFPTVLMVLSVYFWEREVESALRGWWRKSLHYSRHAVSYGFPLLSFCFTSDWDCFLSWLAPNLYYIVDVSESLARLVGRFAGTIGPFSVVRVANFQIQALSIQAVAIALSVMSIGWWDRRCFLSQTCLIA